jgi:nucleoside-diphosphate-sugar epimerase
MRVFVTGATGFIGSAIVQELIKAGYEVLGLARSEEAARALTAAGAAVHRGSLEDLDSLRSGAAATDAVIHTAFNHDFSKYADNCEADRQAIEAMGSVLMGSDRPLVITSGIGILRVDHIVTEQDKPVSGQGAIPRIASEEAAGALVAKGVRAIVMRLPPSVHGAGDHGFVPALIGIARNKGVSAYVGEGLNRWPAVHRFDAARAFRLAMEKGKAGAVFHAVADEGVPVQDIAAVIGLRLNLPVVSKPMEEAAAHFGWLGHFLSLDVPASSLYTQQELGWKPSQPGLLADLDSEHYFKG